MFPYHSPDAARILFEERLREAEAQRGFQLGRDDGMAAHETVFSAVRRQVRLIHQSFLTIRARSRRGLRYSR